MTLHHDEASLTLGRDTVEIAQSYEIKASVLRQPSAFSITVGHGGVVKDLITAYPPKTPFQLRINRQLIQTGFTDGFTVSGISASTVQLRGRDVSARLHDAFMTAEQSFPGSYTFVDITKAALETVGLGDRTIVASNEANRRASTGVDIVQTQEVAVNQEALEREALEIIFVPGTKKAVFRRITAKLGNRWLDFLRTHYDRAGIFLWATGDGNFVLSAPNANQEPAYRVVRRRQRDENPVSAVDADFANDTVRRYTKAIAYGRGGGRNFGRTKIKAEFVDQEMAEIMGGEDAQPVVVHDNEVKTIKAAEFLARRKIAEFNRGAYQLNYTVAGHSVPSLANARKRAVWFPDTVVNVDDEEFGLKRNLYLDEVTFRRSMSGTTTTLHLMRPEDLVYGEGLF